MDTRVKYAFWNNKGGVGKTFLCFATAAEYARQHPDVSVVVMDLCPQANISEILLGGNGDGGEVLDSLLRRLPVARTIGGYYHQRILQPHGLTGTETDFFIRVSDSNKQAPGNLYLIAGDPSLELQVQTINRTHRRHRRLAFGRSHRPTGGSSVSPGWRADPAAASRWNAIRLRFASW